MRIPLIDETAHPKLPALFAHIKKTRGVLSYVLHSLGHAPEGLEAYAAYGEYVRFKSELGARERELAILALACGNQYAWSHHVVSALKSGVTQAEVDVLHDAGTPASLTEREQAAVEFAREFGNHGKVTEPTFRKAQARFGKKGLTDIALLCGYFLALASFANAFDLELEPYYKPLMRERG